MDGLNFFRQERVKAVYWPWKGITDTLLSLLGVLAIGLSGVEFDGFDACAPGLGIDNCENVTIFSYVCLVLGCIFLTFPLVRSNELAWSLRESIVGTEGSATFIAGTSSLSPTSFGEMWLRSGAPSYLWRVVLAALNGLRFVLVLPLELMCCKKRHATFRLELYQWLCFMPSILLVFVQYVLLYVLLKQSEGVLDALLATVSLQVFVELSRHFVQIAFDRERSTGELILPYTAPFTDETKCSAYIMDQLCVNQMLDINNLLPLFRDFYANNKVPVLLRLLRECLMLLKLRQADSVHLKFTNVSAYFETDDVIEAAAPVFAVMNQFKKPCLTLEKEDFDNFQKFSWLEDNTENMMNLGQMKLICTDGRIGQTLNPHANYDTQIHRPTNPFDDSMGDLEEGDGEEEKVDGEDDL